jgi:SAM-dependent methyltransferase
MGGSASPGAQEFLGFSVLADLSEVRAARRELEDLRLPFPSSSPFARRLQRTVALLRGRSDSWRLAPDPLKSWDTWRTLRIVQDLLRPEQAVLDMGSLASAVPVALARRGYIRVSGIDLDPRVTQMPERERIDYCVGDMTKTHWPDGHFSLITCISALEHGVDERRLLAEVRRLLAPGGVFVFSTDYWPAKIDTTGESAFGLPWKIFSREEIEQFVGQARRTGLCVTGRWREPLDAVPAQAPISWNGRRYTFLHGSLMRATAEGGSPPGPNSSEESP